MKKLLFVVAILIFCVGGVSSQTKHKITIMDFPLNMDADDLEKEFEKEGREINKTFEDGVNCLSVQGSSSFQSNIEIYYSRFSKTVYDYRVNSESVSEDDLNTIYKLLYKKYGKPYWDGTDYADGSGVGLGSTAIMNYNNPDFAHIIDLHGTICLGFLCKEKGEISLEINKNGSTDYGTDPKNTEYNYELRYRDFKAFEKKISEDHINDRIGSVVFVLIVIIIFAVIYFCYKNYDKNKEKERKEFQEEEKRRRIEENRKKQELLNKYNKAIEDYQSKYGEQYRAFIFDKEESYDAKTQLFIFPETKYLLIFGHEYKFSDILDCTLNDNNTVIKGSIIAKSNANLGSTIGRALVGGALFGETGAIIGGATSSRTAEITRNNDTVIHNYILNLTVRDIMNPSLKIVVGENRDLADTLFSTFKVIIDSNKES